MDLAIDKKGDGESAQDYVYKTLKRNIIALTLKPGSLISEKSISEILGISRTPVREALIRLSQEELLQISARKSTTVSLIDLKQAAEAVFIRKTLETNIIRRACVQFPEKPLTALKENQSRIETCVKDVKTSALAIFNLDNSFHKLLFAGTKNALAWSVIKQTAQHLDRIRLLKLQESRQVREKLASQHKQLLEAISAHNRIEGVLLMNNHSGRFEREIGSIYQKNRDFFTK